MPSLQVFSDYTKRRNQIDMLQKRILSALSTNTTLLAFTREVYPLKFYPGQPPIGKVLAAPAVYCWVLNRNGDTNAQDAQTWFDNEFILRVALKSSAIPKPIETNTDGTWKENLDTSSNVYRDIISISKLVEYVLVNDGYRNNWYYSFVQHGLYGGPGRVRTMYDQFGGDVLGGDYIHVATVAFTVRTWYNTGYEFPIGNLTVTVTSGGTPVASATVTVKDHYGNYIEDSSGVMQWTTNGSGVASISGLIAQNGSTVYATKSGTGSGSTAQDIDNTITNAVTVTLS